MAVRHVVTVSEDNPILTAKAKRVRKVDASVQALIDDMVETMREAPGVGLAATQIGVPLRVIVVEIPETEDQPDNGKLYTLVNPEIIRTSAEIEEGEEGCLSIPGWIGQLDRHVWVTVKALDRKGREVRIKANDFLARTLQHEIDHLNGVLFTDRLTSREKLIKLSEKEEEAEVSEARELAVA